MPRRGFLAASTTAGLASVAGCSSLTSGSDEYPSGSIEVSIPFTEGGGTDLETRILIEHLQEALGGSLAATNQPEAGGAVLYQEFAGDVDPDGYSLASFFYPLLYTHPQVLPPFDYDPFGFTFLARYSQIPFTLMTGYDSDVESLADLVELGQEEGSLTIAVASPAAPAAIPFLQIRDEFGIDLDPVIVGGGEQLALEAQAGRVDAAVNTFGTTASNFAEQRTKPIGILSEPREDLISFYEENLDIDIQTSMFITEHPDLIDDPVRLDVVKGLMGPPELPSDVQDTLEGGLQTVLDGEEWRSDMVDLGAYPDPTVGDEVEQQLQDILPEIESYIPELVDFFEQYS
ncbi:tripartite tricarboxylate transporter substrate-binding protein [Halobellus sp. GM3]|uniref:tripartite tricarboxylate transporter substrate-binding protein n=1 Tax=Halobellus sp. GM3 TaxID=3458410 RepID=UPI00403D5C80